jgi:proline iminopeptidase
LLNDAASRSAAPMKEVLPPAAPGVGGAPCQTGRGVLDAGATARRSATMPEARLAPNMPDWMVEHATRYLNSGGREGHLYTIKLKDHGEVTAPSLLLTTTGRKSGERYIFPLFYGTAGKGWFIVASKGGASEHPGWYRNILANPEVEVQVGTTRATARARTATGEERARLWQEALKFWPPYAEYQAKTDREIPVVVLDPIG